MKRGFTIIEALVLIAIIGLFGAVVVASFDTKTSRGGIAEPAATATFREIPEAKGHINDYAEVLSHETETLLENELKLLSHEVAVLTVKTTNGMSIEEFGIKVGDAWKVGNAVEDDGVILIIATEDRKLRIEVGYGAEPYITDAEAGRILDNDVIPHLKRGSEDWDAAVRDGVESIKIALSKI